ncbi:hypothetical protein ETAA8_56690 [Anatilimnocola aggregata]|uniref:Peptidase MA-like domain-containing protein n=1 Tax=Anatilimnocola aggregata TaxID=2528021 RepID=A0A517YJX0_9BACT|nr:hypothetical protein [Anatilimnocola aggregata]QDU30524.1 hypothetical protein ETAA8_56690 [Anatilimnocola aggregata]
MEARRVIAAHIALFTLLLSPVVTFGASVRSQNFIVSAPTKALAQEICEAAESQRRDLAIEWLGQELPPWSQPCPVECQIHPQLGAGGATQFSFSRQGVPFGWTMSVQGSRERVLDSVLPHEITHTIFASHFGRPLPRWADEGACTTVEHTSEKRKQEKFLIDFLMTERGIPFNKMFAMKEYPPDMLPLYAQGYSLARYLIMQGGKRKYVQYVGEGMQTDNWPAVTRKYYGHKDLSDLQVTWLEWVRLGSPMLDSVEGRSDVMVASNNRPTAVQQVAQQVAPVNNAIVATPQTHAMPNIVHQPAAPVAPAGNYGSYSQPAGAVSPPRPDFGSATRPEAQASNVARPYSEGWYSRQARQGTDAPQAQQAAENSGNLANQQLLVPPPAPVPVQSQLQSNGERANVAPPANRRVMMEWSRPTNQPWDPASELAANPAVANFSARVPLEPRSAEQLTRRDLPAEASDQAWR